MNSSKKLLITLLALVHVAISFSQSLVINEVVYANKNIMYDIDGDTPDYIELYNTGDNQINLNGFQLTDDTTETNYWTFPEYMIEPGEFLLVFASNKNKINETEFHTDFRLSLMNDPLFLMNPDGKIIDKVDVQCIPSNYALSRKPDGSTNKVVATPTPGKTNNNAGVIDINFLADSLMISHASGFYNQPITLNLSNKIAHNTIYYTLNGDEPDESSLVYNNTIELNDITSHKNRFANIIKTEKETGDKIFKGNIFRAIIYSSGCPASNEISNTYFIDEQQQTDYNVPVISIITEEKNLFDDEIGIYTKGNHNNYAQRGKAWERPAQIEIFSKEKELIIEQNAGIRISGRGSRAGAQKSFRFYARSKYDKEYFEYPFFLQKPELKQFETLLLRSSRGLSGTLLKDELTQVLVQNMNIDYSGTQTAIVFINGEYWGIYSLRERLDEGYIKNNFGVVNPQPDIIRHALSALALEDGSWDSYNSLINFLTSSNPESAYFYNQVAALIDIPELIDFYIAQMYFANYDFPHNNIKMWKLNEEYSKWRYYFFDCDACMIRLSQDQLAEYTNNSDELQIHAEWSKTVLRSLMRNEQFRAAFSKAYYYHIYNTFNPAKVLGELNTLVEVYEPLVAEHTYRWHKPENYKKWRSNIKMLEIFAMQRASVQVHQLEANFGGPFTLYPNPSNGNFKVQINAALSHELEVCIVSSSGTVYYKNNYSALTEIINVDVQLNKGLYIVQLRSKEYVQTVKLIVR